jgi:hypothetical protein
MSKRLHSRARSPRGYRSLPSERDKTDARRPKNAQRSKSAKRPRNAKRPRRLGTPSGRSLLWWRGGRSGPAKAGPKRSSRATTKVGSKGVGVRRKAGTTGSAKKERPNGKPASPGVRRSRIPVALAAVIALVILGTSFPMTALFSQQNGLLAEQQRQLNSTSDVDRLARQDYQMVMPGQTLYDVLPPSGLAGATAGHATPGDPGSQPLVSPTDAPDMTPDPSIPSASASSGGSATPGGSGTGGNAGDSGAGSGRTASAPTGVGSQSSGSGSSGSGAPSAPSSFWSRVTNTLEFWK